MKGVRIFRLREKDKLFRTNLWIPEIRNLWDFSVQYTQFLAQAWAHHSDLFIDIGWINECHHRELKIKLQESFNIQKCYTVIIWWLHFIINQIILFSCFSVYFLLGPENLSGPFYEVCSKKEYVTNLGGGGQWKLDDTMTKWLLQGHTANYRVKACAPIYQILSFHSNSERQIL